MTVGEAASFLNVSRRQVYLLVEHGQLPTVRVGQRIRFIPEDLRGYIAGGRQELAP